MLGKSVCGESVGIGYIIRNCQISVFLIFGNSNKGKKVPEVGLEPTQPYGH